MRFRYFVSYAHGDGALGFGWTEVTRARPIASPADLETITALLEEQLMNVTIIGWQLFEEQPAAAAIT